MNEETLGQRIRKLRLFYKLEIAEFSSMCHLSFSAVQNLEKDITTYPHHRSLKKIADTYNTSLEWLLRGRGEMLRGEAKELSVDAKKKVEDHFKKNAIREAMEKNVFLDKELERLWSILCYFTKVPKGSFTEGHKKE